MGKENIIFAYLLLHGMDIEIEIITNLTKLQKFAIKSIVT